MFFWGVEGTLQKRRDGRRQRGEDSMRTQPTEATKQGFTEPEAAVMEPATL